MKKLFEGPDFDRRIIKKAKNKRALNIGIKHGSTNETILFIPNLGVRNGEGTRKCLELADRISEKYGCNVVCSNHPKPYDKSDYLLPEYFKAVDKFLPETEHLYIMGHSAGALSALFHASTYSDGVDGVVLFDMPINVYNIHSIETAIQKTVASSIELITFVYVATLEGRDEYTSFIQACGGNSNKVKTVVLPSINYDLDREKELLSELPRYLFGGVNENE